ncbi:mCG147691 [Mus musculus]|uniref:Uncharacterized protein n=1 Tax=Mus musculus TaxID=10090 RepID=Q8C2V8_MOUSE|nr:mCG147691 [Mus musculus]BAC40029.1 unnamed protein product [Mus musculus]
MVTGSCPCLSFWPKLACAFFLLLCTSQNSKFWISCCGPASPRHLSLEDCRCLLTPGGPQWLLVQLLSSCAPGKPPGSEASPLHGPGPRRHLLFICWKCPIINIAWMGMQTFLVCSLTP